MLKEKNKITLSASRIKTFESCSWLYYCDYLLKLPKSSNDGANRGTIVHLILECLLNPRHKHHFDSIIKNKTLLFQKSITKLINKHAKKLNVDSVENIGMIHSMILVALQNDFFCNGAIIKAESEFKFENEHFNILGYIDKEAYHGESDIVIWDYKTSKAKFTQDEIEYNLQNLMYSLATYKKYKTIPQINFLFLRFPNKPLQQAPRCSLAQLEGFEVYLGSVASAMASINEKTAKLNLACKSSEKRWLCGSNRYSNQRKEDGSLMWGCPHKFGYEYYIVVDSTGKIKQSSKEKSELQVKDGDKVKKMRYLGCPAFKEAKPKITISDF